MMMEKCQITLNVDNFQRAEANSLSAVASVAKYIMVYELQNGIMQAKIHIYQIIQLIR